MAKKRKSSEQSSKQNEDLIAKLQERFENNMRRHKGLSWPKVLARLEKAPDKVKILGEMEGTGGEPDVIGHDKKSGEYLFCDCAQESPAGRRSLCYDRAALDARKQNKPKGSVVETAASMGIELLDEEQYRKLQRLGNFDTKTSS